MGKQASLGISFLPWLKRSMYLVWCGPLFDGGEKRIDGGTVHAAAESLISTYMPELQKEEEC